MNKIKPIHLLQIGLGINMLIHGLVRLPKLEAFVAKAAGGFTDTYLPMVMVKPFLYALPFIEAAVGLLILLGGNLRRMGLIAGGLLMAALLLGTTLKQDWTVASEQVIYVIAFAIGLHFHDRQQADNDIIIN